MESFKILFFVFLFFNFSICANESNEVKNSFDPNEAFTIDCKDDRSIDLNGKWDNSDNIPKSLSFDLQLKDGSKIPCTFPISETEKNVIKCTKISKEFVLSFSEQSMDSNKEYILKAKKESTNINCLSSYIYSNLLFIFLIIFILIN